MSLDDSDLSLARLHIESLETLPPLVLDPDIACRLHDYCQGHELQISLEGRASPTLQQRKIYTQACDLFAEACPAGYYIDISSSLLPELSLHNIVVFVIIAAGVVALLLYLSRGKLASFIVPQQEEGARRPRQEKARRHDPPPPREKIAQQKSRVKKRPQQEEEAEQGRVTTSSHGPPPNLEALSVGGTTLVGESSGQLDDAASTASGSSKGSPTSMIRAAIRDY